MRALHDQSFPAISILTLAEIKAAVLAFDHGDMNVFDALDAVVVAIETHRSNVERAVRRERQRRDAA